MILLSDGTITIGLHPDLYWSDENDWHPVQQTANRTLTGALVVSVAGMIAGRPVTLQPENESSAWMPLTTVTQLRNWASVPGQVLTLTLRGVARAVMFRHQDGGFEAKPLVHYNEANGADFYLCVVRLMEI